MKAVLGLLVFPSKACWAAQPIDDNYAFVKNISRASHTYASLVEEKCVLGLREIIGI